MDQIYCQFFRFVHPNVNMTKHYLACMLPFLFVRLSLSLNPQERVNRETAEEKEKFRKAIRTFNSEFNLLRNREIVFQSQTRSEIQSLQEEAVALTEGRFMCFLMQLMT